VRLDLNGDPSIFNFLTFKFGSSVSLFMVFAGLIF
jgi:hypothetical protein